MSKYWNNRKAIEALTNKTIDETEAQIILAYSNTYKKIIKEVESLYNKLVADSKDGNLILVSDLYKYDRYYKLIKSLYNELKALGNTEIKILDNKFNAYALGIAHAIDNTYGFNNVIDKEAVKAIVDTVWAPDGKNYSDRVWADKAKLLPVLTQGLIDVIAAGGSSKRLVEDISNIFTTTEVYKIRRLVRTETVYIQSKTALDRYIKAGVTKFRFNTIGDDKVCQDCANIDQKIFLLEEAEFGTNVSPLHPNCRCYITPIVN